MTKKNDKNPPIFLSYPTVLMNAPKLKYSSKMNIQRKKGNMMIPDSNKCELGNIYNKELALGNGHKCGEKKFWIREWSFNTGGGGAQLFIDEA